MVLPPAKRGGRTGPLVDIVPHRGLFVILFLSFFRRRDKNARRPLGGALSLGFAGPHTWTRSMPSTAERTMASTSREASAASTSSRVGRSRGCRGVNTVQQSS